MPENHPVAPRSLTVAARICTVAARIGRVAPRVALIVGVSAVVAAGYATVRGLPWMPDLEAIRKKDERRERVRQQKAEIRTRHGVTIEQFKQLISSGAVIIDARPAEEFERAHLANESYPPVLNVEPDKVLSQLHRLMQLHGQTIVLYCTSTDCELAEELLIELEALQFDLGDIWIFIPGWEGIVAAGLPTTSGPDTWTGYDELIEPEPMGIIDDEPAVEERDPQDEAGAGDNSEAGEAGAGR
jgi:rhodanese-related sulfurtransferase